MKRFFSLLFVVAAAFIAVSCASSPRAQADRPIQVRGEIPSFVRDAMRNAPEDALIAIGVSTHSNINMAMQSARARGRSELAAQLGIFVQYLFGEITVSSEAEAQALVQYTEAMTRQLSQRNLAGSSEVDGDIVAGRYWAVMMLNRSQVAAEILSGLESLAVMEPHRRAYDEGMNRFDDAFRQMNQRPITVKEID